MKKLLVLFISLFLVLCTGCGTIREVKDMEYTATVRGQSTSGIYSGSVKRNIPDGKGIFSARNSKGDRYTYEGEWKNGLFHGEGKLSFDSPEYNIQEGNFSDGEFDPTPYQYFKALGTRKNSSYTIISDAAAFLEKHPDVFLKNSPGSARFDEKFSYKAFVKNPEKFGKRLIDVSSVRVNQISVTELWGGDHTFCIVSDINGENKYYISLYGKTEPLAEGAVISFKALPLASFSYESTTGKKVNAIACAGVSIEAEGIAVQNLLWDFYTDF